MFNLLKSFRAIQTIYLVLRELGGIGETSRGLEDPLEYILYKGVRMSIRPAWAFLSSRKKEYVELHQDQQDGRETTEPPKNPEAVCMNAQA